MTQAPNLTPAQIERLAILAEECGEVIQVVGKILRHGYKSTHPKRPEEGSNREKLTREMGDVLCAMGLLGDAGDTHGNDITAAADDKMASIHQYTHHQGHSVCPGSKRRF